MRVRASLFAQTICASDHQRTNHAADGCVPLVVECHGSCEVGPVADDVIKVAVEKLGTQHPGPSIQVSTAHLSCVGQIDEHRGCIIIVDHRTINASGQHFAIRLIQTSTG